VPWLDFTLVRLSHTLTVMSQLPPLVPESANRRKWFNVDTFARLRWGLIVPLGILTILLVVDTLHWPLVGDAALMHYGAFLLDHGFAPYRQIIDMNMPGCLLVDWAVIHTLRPGAFAWRLFDFALIGVAAGAMISIGWPHDRFAGIFAAVFFFTLHVHDGVDQAGERDLVLAVLLLIGCAAVFAALRHSSWMGSALFGLACGTGTLMKPTAALWMAGMLVLAAIALLRRGQPIAAHLLAACAGFVAPLAAAFLFLAREHAVHAFFATVTGLMVYHAGVDRFPLRFLLTHLLPGALWPIVLLWLPLAFVNRRWRMWEGAALLFSVFIGIVSFSAQGKAFPYHRYPEEAFLLLMMGLDASLALRRRGWPRFVAALILLYATLALMPSWMQRAAHYEWRHDDFTQSLTADLISLDAPSLSHRVQCLDMTAGCLGALYQLRLVQSTGSLYDCYFFHQPQNAVTLQMRDEFLSEMNQSPPQAIIISNQNCLGEPLAWPRADAWPEFSAWLSANYSLVVERQPQRPIRWWPVAEQPPGYRIYRRNAPRRTAAASRSQLFARATRS
jgi:hypothetical protein